MENSIINTLSCKVKNNDFFFLHTFMRTIYSISKYILEPIYTDVNNHQPLNH